MSPLRGHLANFYTPVRPARQKLTSCSKSTHFLRSKWMSMSPLCGRLANFYTAVAPCGKIWPPAANPCIFCSKMASDCSWLLPSWTANFPNLAACQNLLVFKLNSLSKMPFWSLPPPRGLLEVPGPLSLGSSSGFTLRPFGQFLYRGPPCASKVGLLQRIHAFFAVKVDVNVATLR